MTGTCDRRMTSTPRWTAAAARCRRALSTNSSGERPLRYVVQQREHVDHRLVVVGDVARVVLAHREELRPAAVGILRRKQVVEAADRGIAVNGPGDPGQEADLGRRRAVIDRRIYARRRRARRHGGHVDVLRPSTDLTLIAQDVIGDRAGFVARVPCRWLPERIAPADRGLSTDGRHSGECEPGGGAKSSCVREHKVAIPVSHLEAYA